MVGVVSDALGEPGGRGEAEGDGQAYRESIASGAFRRASPLRLPAMENVLLHLPGNFSMDNGGCVKRIVPHLGLKVKDSPARAGCTAAPSHGDGARRACAKKLRSASSFAAHSPARPAQRQDADSHVVRA